jgi:hypothetical protein
MNVFQYRTIYKFLRYGFFPVTVIAWKKFYHLQNKGDFSSWTKIVISLISYIAIEPSDRLKNRSSLQIGLFVWLKRDRAL